MLSLIHIFASEQELEKAQLQYEHEKKEYDEQIAAAQQQLEQAQEEYEKAYEETYGEEPTFNMILAVTDSSDESVQEDFAQDMLCLLYTSSASYASGEHRRYLRSAAH